MKKNVAKDILDYSMTIACCFLLCFSIFMVTALSSSTKKGVDIYLPHVQEEFFQSNTKLKKPKINQISRHNPMLILSAKYCYFGTIADFQSGLEQFAKITDCHNNHLKKVASLVVENTKEDAQPIAVLVRHNYPIKELNEILALVTQENKQQKFFFVEGVF